MLRSEAPAEDFAGPRVALLNDTARGGVRSVRLRITAPQPASTLVVAVGGRARVVGAEVNGEQVAGNDPQEGGATVWSLEYWSPPSEGIEVSQQVNGTQLLALTATAVPPGLPTIPGRSFRGRPVGMMPLDNREDRTMVKKSFRFAAHPVRPNGLSGSVRWDRL